MTRTRALLRSFRLQGRIEYFLFLAGANLVLLGLLMLRHVAVAFPREDIGRAVLGLAFLAGVSLGYGVSDRVSLVTIRRSLPVILLAQMALLLLTPSVHHVVSRDVHAWASQHDLPGATGEWVAGAAVFLLVAVGVSAPYSVFLPLIIQSQEQNLRRYITIAITGGLVGLALAATLSWLPHLWLLSACFLTFALVAHALGARAWMTFGLASMIAVFLVNFATWDRAAAAWLYQRRYGPEVRSVVETRYTPYQKIEVLELEQEERVMALGGRRTAAQRPPPYHHYFAAEYPAGRLRRPNVCALGWTSIRSAARLTDYASVRVVDLDRAVLEVERRLAARGEDRPPLPADAFIADDPRHFLATTRDRFDLVLYAVPEAGTGELPLTCTAEFFQAAKARLLPSGIFCAWLPSPLERDFPGGQRLLATLAHAFEHCFAVTYAGRVYFYGGVESLSPAGETSRLNLPDPSGEGRTGAGIEVLQRDAIIELTRGAALITTGNIGDLIHG